MMLSLWIVASCMITASCIGDVDFSLEMTCPDSMKLTVVYSGSGTVTAVQWYYSGQTASNLLILPATCQVAGSVPAGFPDISRMNFTCNVASGRYTLSLSNLHGNEFEKSWGVTFTLSSGSSPDLQQNSVSQCPNCVCTCECNCLEFPIPAVVFCTLDCLLLIFDIFLSAFGHHRHRRTIFFVLLGMCIVFAIISIVCGVLEHVVDCECECCTESCPNCCPERKTGLATASIVISSIAFLVTIIIGLLVYFAVITLAENADTGKKPGETQEMAKTSL